jgi:hypothetical protein
VTAEDAMKYLICSAGPQDMYPSDGHNTVRLMVGGKKVIVPLHEFTAHPTVPLVDLKHKTEAERRKLIYNAFRQAQINISTQLYRQARRVAVADDDTEFLTLMAFTTPTCLPADDTDDAGVLAMGWVFWTTVGIVATTERPDCFDGVDGDDAFQFWATEPRVPPDPSAYFPTPEGKAKLARQLSVCLGYGPAPQGALTPPELNPSLIPQE